MRRRSKAAVVPTLVVAVLAVGSLLGVDAQVLHSARLRSCLPNDGSAAAADRQLHFSDLWAQFDQGQSRRGELASGVNLSTLPAPIRNQDGAILGGTGDILRVVMTGTVASESAGYSNQTGLLATLLLNSEVLSFDVANNRSSLCSAIRTNEGTTGVTSNGSSTVSSSGCPYQGDIALGFTVPLSSSYPLTTINTNLVALDSSNPAQQLACYDLAFTPFYPDYFPYEVVRFRESCLAFFQQNRPPDLPNVFFLRSDHRNRRILRCPVLRRPLLRVLYDLAARQRDPARFVAHAHARCPPVRLIAPRHVAHDLLLRLGREAGRRECESEALCDGGTPRDLHPHCVVFAHRDRRCRVAWLRLCVASIALSSCPADLTCSEPQIRSSGRRRG